MRLNNVRMPLASRAAMRHSAIRSSSSMSSQMREERALRDVPRAVQCEPREVGVPVAARGSRSRPSWRAHESASRVDGCPAPYSTPLPRASTLPRPTAAAIRLASGRATRRTPPSRLTPSAVRRSAHCGYARPPGASARRRRAGSPSSMSASGSPSSANAGCGQNSASVDMLAARSVADHVVEARRHRPPGLGRVLRSRAGDHPALGLVAQQSRHRRSEHPTTRRRSVASVTVPIGEPRVDPARFQIGHRRWEPTEASTTLVDRLGREGPQLRVRQVDLLRSAARPRRRWDRSRAMLAVNSAVAVPLSSSDRRARPAGTPP